LNRNEDEKNNSRSVLLLTAIVVKAQGKIVVADKSDRTTIHVDDLQDHITLISIGILSVL